MSSRSCLRLLGDSAYQIPPTVASKSFTWDTGYDREPAWELAGPSVGFEVDATKHQGLYQQGLSANDDATHVLYVPKRKKFQAYGCEFFTAVIKRFSEQSDKKKQLASHPQYYGLRSPRTASCFVLKNIFFSVRLTQGLESQKPTIASRLTM